MMRLNKQVSSFLLYPNRRFVFTLARELGKTVGELLYGTANQPPISGYELMQWEALYALEAEESKD